MTTDRPAGEATPAEPEKATPAPPPAEREAPGGAGAGAAGTGAGAGAGAVETAAATTGEVGAAGTTPGAAGPGTEPPEDAASGDAGSESAGPEEAGSGDAASTGTDSGATTPENTGPAGTDSETATPKNTGSGDAAPEGADLEGTDLEGTDAEAGASEGTGPEGGNRRGAGPGDADAGAARSEDASLGTADTEGAVPKGGNSPGASTETAGSGAVRPEGADAQGGGGGVTAKRSAVAEALAAAVRAVESGEKPATAFFNEPRRQAAPARPAPQRAGAPVAAAPAAPVAERPARPVVSAEGLGSVREVLAAGGAPEQLTGPVTEALGEHAAEALRADPWQLLAVPGVRPEQADGFARALLGAECGPDDERRAQALTVWLLERAADAGHTVLEASVLRSALARHAVPDPDEALQGSLAEGAVLVFEEALENPGAARAAREADPDAEVPVRLLLGLDRYAMAEESLADGLGRLINNFEPERTIAPGAPGATGDEAAATGSRTPEASAAGAPDDSAGAPDTGTTGGDTAPPADAEAAAPAEATADGPEPNTTPEDVTPASAPRAAAPAEAATDRPEPNVTDRDVTHAADAEAVATAEATAADAEPTTSAEDTTASADAETAATEGAAADHPGPDAADGDVPRSAGVGHAGRSAADAAGRASGPTGAAPGTVDAVGTTPSPDWEALAVGAVSSSGAELIRAVAGAGVVAHSGGEASRAEVVGMVLAARAAGLRACVAVHTEDGKRRAAELGDGAAVTVAGLLAGREGPGRDADGALALDLLAVPDAPQLDVEAAAMLVESLADGTRLVLSGDPGVLWSAGPGRVFADVLAAQSCPVVVSRTPDPGPIGELVSGIGVGELGQVEAPGKEVVIVPVREPAEAVHRTVQLVADSIPRAIGVPADRTQVITPGHGGPAGTRALNAALKERLNPGPGRFGGFDPGDRIAYVPAPGRTVTGTVVSADAEGLRLDCGGTPVVVPRERVGEEVRHGWAVTAHQAAGARWPAAVVVLPGDAARTLTRSWVYTAFGRAERHLSVVHGVEQALPRAVAEVPAKERTTRLRSLLRAQGRPAE
ncbi:helix-hairpin-helix domain-containing protein [Streptomyces albireticuli]|uniref:helix-hairpin-helix domain-containing protein n=1 Tax=Streptomyces albireticuli TaxID=1940 RepID=UPI0036A754C4